MKTLFHIFRFPLLLAILVWAGVSGCQSGAVGPDQAETALRQPFDPLEEGVSASIELTSRAFADGEAIPTKYTEDGRTVSPPFAWPDVPAGTRELVLICDDPDAPSPLRPGKDPWVHWVLYKIPADVRALPEGIPRTPRLDEPAGAVQGRNSWGKGENVGYRGPAPPKRSGKHRYFFKLYALDTELSLGPEQDKPSLVKAMLGHVIGKGQLVGTYQR